MRLVFSMFSSFVAGLCGIIVFIVLMALPFMFNYGWLLGIPIYGFLAILIWCIFGNNEQEGNKTDE